MSEHKAEHPEAMITCFQADNTKDGGAYLTVTGRVKKIDDFQRTVIMEHGEQISIEHIYEVESEQLHLLF